MKLTLGIRGRFLAACALLLVTTTASSVWSALALDRVSRVVGVTLWDTEQTTSATGALQSALEREDDALLLMLTDPRRGRPELEAQRAGVLAALSRVERLLTGPTEREGAARLRGAVAAYDDAGQRLIEHPEAAGVRLRYHEDVNPLLRRAVGDCIRIREAHFRSTQEVATWARDQAARSVLVLLGVSLAALAVSFLVSLYLARSIVEPIRVLTGVVEGMRGGDFDRRVRIQRRDEVGQLAVGFNRMADDLAEFRRANFSEVLRAKETLEATLSALPDAVFVIGLDGRVTSANLRASAVMAAKPGRSSGVAALPIPAEVQAELLVCARGGKQREPTEVDLSRAIVLHLGGETRRLLPRIVKIDGGPEQGYGAVLVLSDVTDLARLDEMRTELVAVASHELRTPLTTLRMTLLMLQEGAAALDARGRELVSTALLGVEQLGSTVDEFLDLTRIEAGQLRLEWDSIDLGVLLGRVHSSLEPQARESGVSLCLHIRQDLPATVAGDEARLAVVFSNILGNAIKYTPAAGRIRVDAGPAPFRGAGGVQVAITDSGSGIPPEYRNRVFEKFFRVEHQQSSRGTGLRGAGIGLYIARQLVAAHGGEISCEAGPEGAGARFVVQLPLDARHGDPLLKN